MAYWKEAVNNPAKLIEDQMEYWSKTVTQFVETQQAMATGKADAGEADTAG